MKTDTKLAIKNQVMALIEKNPSIRTSQIFDKILEDNPLLNWDETIKVTIDSLDELKAEAKIEGKSVRTSI
jgi:hypothetical protein